MNQTDRERERRWQQKRQRVTSMTILAILIAVLCIVCIIYLCVKKATTSYKRALETQKSVCDTALKDMKDKSDDTDSTAEEYIIIEPKIKGPEVFKKMHLNVSDLMQQPELPSGSEATALTACLNYLGFSKADKVKIARMMPQGKAKKSDPDKVFVGNPEEKGAFGCNAPVVVKTANKFLSTCNTDVQAYDISGHELAGLCAYIENGYPVIIWGTEYMEAPSKQVTWNTGDREVTWMQGFHCCVLTGWNEKEYIVMDPLHGTQKYSKADVEAAYEVIGRQAVVIQ